MPGFVSDGSDGSGSVGSGETSGTTSTRFSGLGAGLVRRLVDLGFDSGGAGFEVMEILGSPLCADSSSTGTSPFEEIGIFARETKLSPMRGPIKKNPAPARPNGTIIHFKSQIPKEPVPWLMLPL